MQRAPDAHSPPSVFPGRSAFVIAIFILAAKGDLNFHRSGSQSDTGGPQLLPPDASGCVSNKPQFRSKKAGKFKSCHTRNEKPLAMQGVVKSSGRLDAS
jgi:hypothetical protein